MRLEAPPFQRGHTMYEGITVDMTKIPPAGQSLEGTEWEFADVDLSQYGAEQMRSNETVRVRVVRNVSTIALAAKRLVTMQKTGTDGRYYEGRVDGYVNTTADRCFPVDEWIGSAGVPINDLFYVVVRGPAVLLTDNATLSANIAVGDQMVSATAAASTSTTLGGGANSQDLTGATTLLANQIRNAIGRALSACTTGNTASPLLVDVSHW